MSHLDRWVSELALLWVFYPQLCLQVCLSAALRAALQWPDIKNNKSPATDINKPTSEFIKWMLYTNKWHGCRTSQVVAALILTLGSLWVLHYQKCVWAELETLSAKWALAFVCWSVHVAQWCLHTVFTPRTTGTGWCGKGRTENVHRMENIHANAVIIAFKASSLENLVENFNVALTQYTASLQCIVPVFMYFVSI